MCKNSGQVLKIDLGVEQVHQNLHSLAVDIHQRQVHIHEYLRIFHLLVSLVIEFWRFVRARSSYLEKKSSFV
jgi:hypothetical protein